MNKAIEAPETIERNHTSVERLENDGSLKKWDAFAIEDSVGKKNYYLKETNADRYAILPEEDFQMEQEMRRETEKFAAGKTWDSFTALLTEGESEIEDNAGLKQYLNENKGRILEYACFIAMHEQISQEEALAKTAKEVQGVNSAEKGHFELDYAIVAKALNTVTKDYLLKESDTVDAKQETENRNIANIGIGFATLFHDPEGGWHTSEKTMAKADAARFSISNENMWKPLLSGEVYKTPEQKLPLMSLEDMRDELLQYLQVATADLQNQDLSIDVLRKNERIVLDKINLFRLAESREMAQTNEDISPEWRDFLLLSAKAKIDRGGKEEKIRVGPAIPNLNQGKGMETAPLPAMVEYEETDPNISQNREEPEEPNKEVGDIITRRAKKIRAKRREVKSELPTPSVQVTEIAPNKNIYKEFLAEKLDYSNGGLRTLEQQLAERLNSLEQEKNKPTAKGLVPTPPRRYVPRATSNSVLSPTYNKPKVPQKPGLLTRTLDRISNWLTGSEDAAFNG